jgi:hypothetical protein
VFYTRARLQRVRIFVETTTAGNCIAGWQQKESAIARDKVIFHSYPVSKACLTFIHHFSHSTHSTLARACLWQTGL